MYKGSVRVIRFLRLGFLLPKFAREMMELLPQQLAKGNLPAKRLAKGEAKGQVGFIEGCVMQVMFSDTNESSVELLNRDGWDVLTPKGQGCCGALYAHSGQLTKARDCARRNIVAFEGQPLDAIIINAAGCGSTLKEYGHLLRDDPVYADRARVLAGRCQDVSELLDELEPRAPRHPVPLRIADHDACHPPHAPVSCTHLTLRASRLGRRARRPDGTAAQAGRRMTRTSDRSRRRGPADRAQ